MSREYGLDAQGPQEIQNSLQVQALILQGSDSVFDAAGLRALGVLDEIVAPASDAVDAFGEVDDLEPARKSPDQVASQRRRAVANARRQFAGRLRVAVTTADGGDAVELDQLEKVVAALVGLPLPH